MGSGVIVTIGGTREPPFPARSADGSQLATWNGGSSSTLFVVQLSQPKLDALCAAKTPSRERDDRHVLARTAHRRPARARRPADRVHRPAAPAPRRRVDQADGLPGMEREG